MIAVAAVVLLWALFGGTHVLLATSRLRARLGAAEPRRFMFVFGAIAITTFALLVLGTVNLAAMSPPTPTPVLAALRVPLRVASALALVPMLAAFAPQGYWTSPASVVVADVRPARGMERISRHPFWCGTVVLALAEALLAPRLALTAFWLGFVVLVVAGTFHQTQKLRARYGAPYDDYLATTSAIPFLAIARGRQQLVSRELPWPWLAASALAAVAFYVLAPELLAFRGVPFLVAVAGGSTAIGVIAARRDGVTPGLASS